MKRIFFVMLAVGLATYALAETMDKEEAIDTAAKILACIEAGYLRSEVKELVQPRLRYFAKNHFTTSEIYEMDEIVRIRAKTTITTMGWGCEAAFKTVMALPVPPK